MTSVTRLELIRTILRHASGVPKFPFDKFYIRLFVRTAAAAAEEPLSCSSYIVAYFWFMRKSVVIAQIQKRVTAGKATPPNYVYATVGWGKSFL